jgi:hypothetical protein
MHFMFLAAVAGAVVGAVIGGVVAAANGNNVFAGALVGAAIGGVIGLTCGAAAGVMFAGSATALTAAVMSGGTALVSAASAGRLGTGARYVTGKVRQSCIWNYKRIKHRN